MRKLQLGVFLAAGLAMSMANAAVDLDRICLLDGKGYEGGDVVLAPQGSKGEDGDGIVCSVIAGEAVWLSLAEQSVGAVKNRMTNTDQPAVAE